MITISSDFLDAHWEQLIQNGVLLVELSEWDEGDAYALAEIGAIPSRTIRAGHIVIGETEVPNARILIRLRPDTEAIDSPRYRCPDGTEYIVAAQRMVSGDFTSVTVRIENFRTRLSDRRKGVIETDLLSDKSVLIIGLGTGGTTVALELAKSGVGKFTLVDPDRL